VDEVVVMVVVVGLHIYHEEKTFSGEKEGNIT